MAARFGFTRLIVEDLAGLTAFYQSAFGMIEAFVVRDSLAGEPFEEVVLTSGGDPQTAPVLVLFRFLGKPAPSRGESHLGFLVDDIHDAVARAVAAGARVVHPPKLYDQGAAPAWAAFVADPEGHLIELAQMMG